jgi:hypothetical protein
MRIIADKICRENQNTHLLFSNFFFQRILSFMRQCREDKSEPDGPQMLCNTAHALRMLGT